MAEILKGKPARIGSIALLLAALFFAATALAATTGSVQITNTVSGGTAKPSQFTLQIVKGGSTIRASGNTITFSRLMPGTYTITKASGPSGYSMVWSGDCNAKGEVVIVADIAKKCTLTHAWGTPPPPPPTDDRSTRTDRTR